MLPVLKITSVLLHVIGCLLLVLFATRSPARIILVSFSGALIGLASLSTIKKRPAPFFVAFGLLISVSFWLTIDAIRIGSYLDLIPVMLLVAGVSWFLRVPGWPSVLMTTTTVLLLEWIAAIAFQHRYDNEYLLPEEVAESVLEISTLLLLGLLQAWVGFGLFQLRGASKPRKPKKGRREIVAPRPD